MYKIFESYSIRGLDEAYRENAIQDSLRQKINFRLNLEKDFSSFFLVGIPGWID